MNTDEYSSTNQMTSSFSDNVENVDKTSTINLCKRPVSFVLTGPISIVTRNGNYDKIHLEMERFCKLRDNKYDIGLVIKYLDARFQMNLRKYSHHDFAVIQLLQGCVLAVQLSGETKPFHKCLKKTFFEVLNSKYNLHHYSHVAAMFCYRLFFGYLYNHKLGITYDLLQCAKSNLTGAMPNAWTAKVHHMDAIFDIIYANRVKTTFRKLRRLQQVRNKLTIACEQCLCQIDKDSEMKGYYSTYFSIQHLCILLDMPLPLLLKINKNLLLQKAKMFYIREVDIASADSMLLYARRNKPHHCGIYSQDANFLLAVGQIYLSLRKLQHYIETNTIANYVETFLQTLGVIEEIKAYDINNTVSNLILNQLIPFIASTLQQALFRSEKPNELMGDWCNSLLSKLRKNESNTALSQDMRENLYEEANSEFEEESDDDNCSVNSEVL